jgi:hypothetical protein
MEVVQDLAFPRINGPQVASDLLPQVRAALEKLMQIY